MICVRYVTSDDHYMSALCKVIGLCGMRVLGLRDIINGRQNTSSFLCLCNIVNPDKQYNIT